MDEKLAEGSRADGDTGGASNQEPWRSACIGAALLIAGFISKAGMPALFLPRYRPVL